MVFPILDSFHEPIEGSPLLPPGTGTTFGNLRPHPFSQSTQYNLLLLVSSAGAIATGDLRFFFIIPLWCTLFGRPFCADGDADSCGGCALAICLAGGLLTSLMRLIIDPDFSYAGG